MDVLGGEIAWGDVLLEPPGRITAHREAGQAQQVVGGLGQVLLFDVGSSLPDEFFKDVVVAARQAHTVEAVAVAVCVNDEFLGVIDGRQGAFVFTHRGRIDDSQPGAQISPRCLQRLYRRGFPAAGVAAEHHDRALIAGRCCQQICQHDILHARHRDIYAEWDAEGVAELR